MPAHLRRLGLPVNHKKVQRLRHPVHEPRLHKLLERAVAISMDGRGRALDNHLYHGLAQPMRPMMQIMS
jgi:hypothetical protein